MANADGQISSRFGRFLPDEVFPRRDLIAGLAIAVLAGQILFAQATLILVICCLIAWRAGRWRPEWLVIPAAIGLGWVLAIGVRPGLAGYAACAQLVLHHLAGTGTLPDRLRRVPGVITAWPRWLPAQFPVALITAAGETALIGWLGRGGRTWKYRSGALVAARNLYLVLTLRRGEVATRGGCCVGVDLTTGKKAEITWRAAESGVLCTSSEQAAAAATGRDLVLAAIQHRKTVIVIDLAGSADSATAIARECAAAGAPLDNVAGRGPHYDSFPEASLVARAFAERRVVLFGPPGQGNRRAATAIASLMVADLIENLAERSDYGGRHDCLAWINGCEAIGADQLGKLLALGAITGTAVVLTTSAGQAAARLAGQVNVIAVRGTGPSCPVTEPAADLLRGPGEPGVLSLWTARPAARHLTDCAVVR